MRKSFFYLCLYSAAGIFLHELAHHVFGIQSLVSLSRNWPLVAVNTENYPQAVAGTLAGPVTNLLLGYAGLVIYRFRSHPSATAAGLYGGLANLFLVLSGAVINLVVDWLSGSWGNDLQQVSVLMGWHVLILPIVFVALAAPGFRYLYARWTSAVTRWWAGSTVLIGAWFLAGAVLMLVDTAFHIRFTLR